MKYGQIPEINPPESPKLSGSDSEWIQIEERLGIKFPQDFKLYTGIYGRGLLCGFLLILNPFTEDASMSALEEMMHEKSKVYNVLKEEFEELKDYIIGYKPGNLLIWGNTVNGDDLYWIIGDEKQDTWSTIIFHNGDYEKKLYSLCMLDLIKSLIDGSVNVSFFRKDSFDSKTFQIL